MVAPIPPNGRSDKPSMYGTLNVMEVWKDIINFENYYQISSSGNLKNVRTGRIKKWGNHTRGYLITTLCRSGYNKSVSAHRLVAQAFIPNPKKKPCVNHKNGIKYDNKIENLEWCTHQENTDHAVRNKLVGEHKIKKRRKGADHPLIKLSTEEILYIRANHKIIKTSVLAKMFNISSSAVGNIGARRTRKYE